MSSVDLTPRAHAKRAAILAAAQELFPRWGFEGASMDAIAAAAHVSKQTLYRYYQNKETLFIATLQQLALEQAGMVSDLEQGVIESLPALERELIAWAQASVANTMRPAYLALLRVLVAEMPRFPNLGSLFASAIPQQGASAIMSLLSSAAAHGVIEVADVDAAVRLLAGALLTYLFGDGLFSFDGLPHPPSPERVAAIVRLFLQALVSSRKAEE